MSTFDLAVRGGTVVSSSGRARLDLFVRDGRVVHIGSDDGTAAETVDATGLFVLPGMVDTHVHLMDPGPTEREDFPTGTAAAAAAGVTTIVEHTHAHPIRSLQEFAAKRAHLEGRAHVDYGLAAHTWPDRLPELAELWRAGITFFKIFTCSTHGVPGLDAGNLQRALSALAGFGGPCLIHCEDESLTAHAEEELRAAGRDDPSVIIEWRNREAELVASAVAAMLVRLTGARATIAHVSSPAVVQVIDDARRAGADIAAETCPQYFLLREQDILDHGPFRKFTPPARGRSDADEDEMWRLLRTGAFHHVATDHAPATVEQKTDGSIWDVHFGLPGLETTLPMLLDATARGLLALEDVVRVYAEAPARRYGLISRKGSLRVSADADFVLADLGSERTLSDDDIISKAGWTPYRGRTVTGAIVASYLRGTCIAEAGRPRREFGGRFLPGAGACP